MNTNTTDVELNTEVIHLFENGRTISEKLRKEIFTLVTDIPPGLPADEKYTLQSLCGADYWSLLSMSERRSAGMYMAYMVREELIPYVFAGKPCQPPKTYKMI